MENNIPTSYILELDSLVFRGGGGGGEKKIRERRGGRGGNACRKGLCHFVSTAADGREILIGLF